MNDSPKVAQPAKELDIRRTLGKLEETADALTNKINIFLENQHYVMRPGPPTEPGIDMVSECALSEQINTQTYKIRNVLKIVETMIECTEF